eukprot:gnl/MRDRNA2_/MRDRNA2_104885_c0_seq1.p1 gnl/MRDRNA2_/MRDRNA2_104885_c0~~gnl/MRDRNA2_/MRDRNA2_104885_c0_seq1.p1  ORF type:complete len:595 (-),score=100.09 gnl/MRDRNA2_/MRDRNA2_104885_c0_seq1:103-1887(-)
MNGSRPNNGAVTYAAPPVPGSRYVVGGIGAQPGPVVAGAYPVVSMPPAVGAMPSSMPVSPVIEPTLMPSPVPPDAIGEPEREFEEMVGDLRRSFIGWLKRTETELKEKKGDMRREKQAFEEEKIQVWRQFMAEKQKEVEKIKEDRRRSELEISGAMRQIQADREEARRKIAEERSRMEQDHDKKRRHLAHEREKFRQEYELFENDRQKVQDPHLATEAMVDLNVGGSVFETARATLVQQPGSFLESVVSGRHRLSRDRNGRIFINRDPELFRLILNFLRNPAVPPMPRDHAESEALVTEASWFGVRFFPFPLVFACGGHNGYEHLRSMEVLDVGNQCWRPCRPMSTERTYFGAATLSSRLFLFGGQNLDYKALCELEIYDCLRDAWTSGASLSVPRRNCASTTLNGCIYAIGGFDGSQIIASVEAYDLRMKSWMSQEPLPLPRSSCMAAVQDGKIWVLGGTSGTRTKTVEFFEPRMGKWESLNAEMLEVRSSGQAACCVNHLFSLGGIDNNQTIHYSLECLDPDSLTWSFRQNMQVSRMDFSSVVISDSVMVAGGQNGDVLSSTEFYRPELDDWQPGPSMLFPRYGHQCLLVQL